MFSNNLTMMTDLYELTMMQGYFFEGNEDKVVFDVFTAKIHPAVLMPSPVDSIR